MFHLIGKDTKTYQLIVSMITFYMLVLTLGAISFSILLETVRMRAEQNYMIDTKITTPKSLPEHAVHVQQLNNLADWNQGSWQQSV